MFVADDSPVARRAVVRRLAAAGVPVIEGDSATPPRGLDPCTLACALVDLDLGDGDGTDLAHRLRREAADLPVAFFSAGAAPELKARAAKMGPVFTKPDELDDAVRWIEKQAGRPPSK